MYSGISPVNALETIVEIKIDQVICVQTKSPISYASALAPLLFWMPLQKLSLIKMKINNSKNSLPEVKSHYRYAAEKLATGTELFIKVPVKQNKTRCE